MGPESSRELAENKLILLYIIDKINMPVSNLQVTKIILENRLMNYFYLQQYIGELCETGFLSSQTSGNKVLYSITQNGKQALSYFQSHILPGIRARIDDTIASIKTGIRNETLISADYIPESEDRYIVKCCVKEDNFTLIDLSVAVGSKKDARMVCENWKKHTQSIYSEIIGSITRER